MNQIDVDSKIRWKLYTFVADNELFDLDCIIIKKASEGNVNVFRFHNVLSDKEIKNKLLLDKIS